MNLRICIAFFMFNILFIKVKTNTADIEKKEVVKFL